MRTDDDYEVEINVRINPKLDVNQRIGSRERGDKDKVENEDVLINFNINI